MHQFRVGDYASTSHLSDQSPVVVTHVNASGKTIRVRRLSFTIKPGHAEFGAHYGIDDVQDVEPAEMRASEAADNEDGYYDSQFCEETYRFTTRKRGGARFRGPGGRLSAGFCSYRDPHM